MKAKTKLFLLQQFGGLLMIKRKLKWGYNRASITLERMVSQESLSEPRPHSNWYKVTALAVELDLKSPAEAE